jgi:hypothetical protein
VNHPEDAGPPGRTSRASGSTGRNPNQSPASQLPRLEEHQVARLGSGVPASPAPPGRTESPDAAHTSARIRVAASFPGRRGAGQGSNLFEPAGPRSALDAHHVDQHPHAAETAQPQPQCSGRPGVPMHPRGSQSHYAAATTLARASAYRSARQPPSTERQNGANEPEVAHKNHHPPQTRTGESGFTVAGGNHLWDPEYARQLDSPGVERPARAELGRAFGVNCQCW